jgi:3-deoxy-manno-octulosonate cytidylyltransferase (CMP-KDO synthetase)
MTFNVVIPARYASTRLPGKPLLDIAGKPMVLWVVERAVQSGAQQVIVATDDERILNIVQSHGYEAVMTRSDHLSGTDRIAEVAEALNWHDDAIVVNVQGDEPLIEPQIIRDVAARLTDDAEAVMSTACFPINHESDFLNPNVVKVVMSEAQRALYFSRAPIPYPRNQVLDQAKSAQINAHRHIGIYAYRTSFLKQYSAIQPASIETIESLEQLRVLYAGYQISVHISNAQPETGVDTQEDLDHVRMVMQKSL